METSHNTIKVSQHNGNRKTTNKTLAQHDGNKLQHNGDKPQYNKITTTQRKQATTQCKQATKQLN